MDYNSYKGVAIDREYLNTCYTKRVLLILVGVPHPWDRRRGFDPIVRSNNLTIRLPKIKAVHDDHRDQIKHCTELCKHNLTLYRWDVSTAIAFVTSNDDPTLPHELELPPGRRTFIKVDTLLK